MGAEADAGHAQKSRVTSVIAVLHLARPSVKMIIQQSVKTAIVAVVIGAPHQMAVWTPGRLKIGLILQHLSLNYQTVDLHQTIAIRKTVRQLPGILALTSLSLAFIHVFRKEKSHVFSRNTAMLKVVLS